MAQQYPALNEKHIDFIQQQKLFFVATATADSRINLSPKGLDSLRVMASDRVVWLNMTGSGNETSAHIQQDTRMTLMFSAFEGNPMILRVYGNARVIHQKDKDWEELYAQFEPLAGARQLFDMRINLVQTSCGFGVPLFDYVGERGMLDDWSEKKGTEGIKQYWNEKNQHSIDGLDTFIIAKST